MRELLTVSLLLSSTAAFAGTLHFERDLPTSVETLWPLVTDPVRMNEWSRAQVELVTPGPDGGPDEVGAVRQVTVRALFRSVLMERVEESEPPHRFAYTVTSGGGMRSHLGTVTLTPTDGGTRLTWHVEFAPRIPLTGCLLKAVVRPQLTRSLDDLEALLAGQ